MAIAENQDLFSCVQELAAALHDEGAEELAGGLSDALSISSLPGEVLGEIRMALLMVRRHSMYKRLDIRRRVDDGIAYLDRVLGSSLFSEDEEK